MPIIIERFTVSHWLLGVAAFILVLNLPITALASLKANENGNRLLTLEQLQEMALAHNPAINISESEVLSARSDLKKVRSAYYPQLDATVVTGPASDADEPVVVDGKIIDPSPRGVFDLGIFGRLDFTLTQPLYTFGKLSNRKEAALRGVKARQVEIAQRRAETIVRVKQLYYALILARQGMDVADESEEYFSEIRDRIEQLLELGSVAVDESDLYMVDAYSAEAKGFRAEAQKGERVAKFALKSMIGMPQEQDFEVEQALPTQRPALEPLQAYVDRALGRRPEIKQLEYGIDAQKYMVEAAKSDRYPSFFATVLGSFAGAPGRDRFDTPYFTDEFNHAYAGFFAGIQWHFDFGIQNAQVEKERAEYHKLLSTRAYAEQNIPIEVANIYQEVLQYQQSLEAFDEAASASRRWVVVAFTNFDMGIGTAQRIFEAIEKYGRNRGRYLETLYNYNLALAQLDYAIGTISSSD
jgi:outer membrane protein